MLACIVCFLIDVKGFHSNVKTGLCQRFSCQNGGSGASQFIFSSIAVTYIVCSFSLLINNILRFMAVRHKSNSLIVWLGCFLSLMAHTPCLLAFEYNVKSTRQIKPVALRDLRIFYRGVAADSGLLWYDTVSFGECFRGCEGTWCLHLQGSNSPRRLLHLFKMKALVSSKRRQPLPQRHNVASVVTLNISILFTFRSI